MACSNGDRRRQTARQAPPGSFLVGQDARALKERHEACLCLVPAGYSRWLQVLSVCLSILRGLNLDGVAVDGVLEDQTLRVQVMMPDLLRVPVGGPVVAHVSYQREACMRAVQADLWAPNNPVRRAAPRSATSVYVHDRTGHTQFSGHRPVFAREPEGSRRCSRARGRT